MRANTVETSSPVNHGKSFKLSSHSDCAPFPFPCILTGLAAAAVQGSCPWGPEYSHQSLVYTQTHHPTVVCKFAHLLRPVDACTDSYTSKKHEVLRFQLFKKQLCVIIFQGNWFQGPCLEVNVTNDCQY